ncbi:MAG: hypothetical protein ACE15B_14385 [Bryobacteraceae bacterium]
MKKLAAVVPLALCGWFVLAGCLFVPRLGIQADEVYFSGGLYEPAAYRYGVRIFHRRVPLMLLNYLGATKTWFYAALFRVWPLSLNSLRVPMLAGGAAAVALFWLLLARVAGRRAAVIGAVLLATDAVFLLVTLWGPVLFYHLLLLGSLLLFVRFHRTGGRGALAAAAFCAGLGLWDKALFLWALAGMAAAALAAFPRPVLRAVTRRNAAAAALGLLAGALPLAMFNVNSRGETLRGNSSFTLTEVAGKAEVLRDSLDGSLLFGWIVAEEGVPRAPRGPVERAACALSDAFGQPTGSPVFWAYAAAFVLLPLLWRTPARKPVLFALVFSAVTWVQMAVTRNAGAAAHHTLLLWPMPHLAAAVVIAEVSRRGRRTGVALAAAVVLVLAGGNVLVANQYLAQAVRYGPGPGFSDAIFPLADYLERLGARPVFLADWGMLDPLRFLGRGKLPLRVVTDPLVKPADGGDRKKVAEWLAEPGHVFVSHTKDRAVYPAARARLLELAAACGYRPEPPRVIADGRGRPVFEVYRFSRIGGR